MKRVVTHIWDFPSAVILTLILLTVAERFFTTEWAPGLALAVILAIFGTLLGFALGGSQFLRWGVYGLTFCYSLALTPLVIGWIMYPKIPWLERMISLAGRLGNSLLLFITSQSVPDTALFVIFSGLGFWSIGLLSGFALIRRGHFIAAAAPAGIVLFIIQFYDSRVGDHVIVLGLYAFLCLLLLGRLTSIRKRVFWKEQHVSFSGESWTDLNLGFPIAALVLILLAWVTPVTGHPVVAAKEVWENITHPLDKIRKDLSNAISGLKGNDQGTIVEFYGNTLNLGENASSGTKTYLRIRVPLTGVADRYYWRVRTYDQYLDNQWQSNYGFNEPVTPDQPSIQLLYIHGLSSEFVFSTPRVNLGILVTPANPIWVSRPSMLRFTPGDGNKIDPLMFRADPPILIGEQYTVHANIFNPTIAQLQEAGETYPAWVSDHYLQLPGNLSPQVFTLARRITATAQTPYEKAAAITDYLRETITYSLTVDLPPEGTDPLVWFLIKTKTGFCNYYASAEVILLRSVGVPARMVVGFAQGEYEPPDKYTVIEKDAHAWPEVYFPGVGWVEFEPTTQQPVLTRLPGDSTPTEQAFSFPTQSTGQDKSNQSSLPDDETGGASGKNTSSNFIARLMLFFGVLMALIVGGFLAYSYGLLDKIFWGARRVIGRPLPILLTDTFTSLAITPPRWLKNWAFFSGLSPIERTFNAVFQSLGWLGARPATAQTPAECAAGLIMFLPEVTDEAHSLLKEYQLALFSRKHFDLYAARDAAKMIRRQALRKLFHQRMKIIQDGIQRVFSRKQK